MNQLQLFLNNQKDILLHS